MMPVGKGKVVITINIFILNITTIFNTTIIITTVDIASSYGHDIMPVPKEKLVITDAFTVILCMIS